jgi:zinc protease
VRAVAATLRLHEGYARPIHETVVDGVQTFWADDDDDEPFEAKLLFRVGRADESLLTSGVSHLIEHLALPQHDRHLSYVNGTTEPLLTYFEGAGERREVLDFLQEVSANLGKLPLDRLRRKSPAGGDDSSRPATRFSG